MVLNHSLHHQAHYVPGIQSYSLPPSPLRAWYSIILFTTKHYVSGIQWVFSRPSPIRIWYWIILFTTKPITCLVFNQSFHDQVQYVSGIQSFSSPPSITCLVFNHSLHHQALRAWYSIILFTTKHYVSDIQSFSSPPRPLRVWYGISLFTTNPSKCLVLFLIRWPNNQSRIPGSVPRPSLWMVYR